MTSRTVTAGNVEGEQAARKQIKNQEPRSKLQGPSSRKAPIAKHQKASRKGRNGRKGEYISYSPFSYRRLPLKSGTRDPIVETMKRMAMLMTIGGLCWLPAA